MVLQYLKENVQVMADIRSLHETKVEQDASEMIKIIGKNLRLINVRQYIFDEKLHNYINLLIFRCIGPRN
jgi:hypothetical protein